MWESVRASIRHSEIKHVSVLKWGNCLIYCCHSLYQFSCRLYVNASVNKPTTKMKRMWRIKGQICSSVLWRCWLGGRKGIRSVKITDWWGTGVVICLERGADLHMAQLMPLPRTVSSKSQIGFTFLVPAYPGCPGKEAVKWLLLCCLFFVCIILH